MRAAPVAVACLDLARVAPAQLARLAGFCDADERARAARFRVDADRAAFLAAHGLLRLTLSTHAAAAPGAWRFAADATGKPFLLDPPRDLRFSLSHTRGAAAVAVAEACDVGVDVEAAQQRAADMAVAENFFAPDEIAQLRAAEGPVRRDQFFALWVVKEAVVKATGEGLSRPLDSFSVALSPLRVTMRGAAAAEGWSLFHTQRDGFHLAAAARCADAAFAVDWVDVAALLQPAG